MVRRERGRLKLVINLKLVIKVTRRKKIEAVPIDLEILMCMMCMMCMKFEFDPEDIYLRHKNYDKRLAYRN